MRARILIIAKGAEQVVLLSEALRSDGHTVTISEKAEEIRRLLLECAADLVIVDIGASPAAESGFVEKLKKDFPDLPLVCITGSTLPGAADIGPHGTLVSKPFRISHIEEIIDKLLDVTPDQRKESAPAILVVDDDEMFRNLLVRSLRLSGYAARQADDGRAALAMLETGNIWAVIADINMPDIDGISLMETIKRDRPEIPVILITGYYSSHEWSEKSDISPDGFLMKPFKAQQINRLIETITQKRSGR
jgi:DNA-binding NtrC family response regulator